MELLLFIGICALVIIAIFISVIVVTNHKNEKFRKEYHEIGRNVLSVKFERGMGELVFDIVFTNNEGHKVYKHQKFYADRYNEICEWLQSIGAEELLFEDYNDLLKK